MAMTIEQQRALALARARARASQKNGHAVPEYVPPGVEGYNPDTGWVEAPSNAPKAALLGGADGASLGFLDEATAGIISGIENVRPGGSGASYSDVLRDLRRDQSQIKEANPGAYLAGQVAGGIGSAVAATPLMAAPRAIQAGSSLARVAGASAVDGTAVGALSGAGAGEDMKGKIRGAILGAGGGFALGAAAPYAMTGVGAATSPVVSALTSRLRPETYANRALGSALQRSGRTADQVATDLLTAQADGQPMFTVADALGHTGRRALSTVTRTPNDARQGVVDALEARQAGQGRRITGALSEAFDAPDTALQRQATLTRARDQAADMQFRAARQNAGPVDVTGALSRIDQTLQPGVNRVVNPGNNIANDTVEQALARARSLLSDGQSNSVDFNAVYRARQDIADWAQAARQSGHGNRARELGGVLGQLDTALENSSPGYRAAMNNFRDASRDIDAVEMGRNAARRGRSQDTIPAFQNMPASQQAGFRAGYVDPLIEQAEGAATGVNKARPLINDATNMEFPAFAAPGRADQLQRRIGREQSMFETRNQALGNSSTAQNLADMADAGQHTGEILMSGVRGGVSGMVMTALARAMNEGRGLPPSVLAQLGHALMETNPQAARQILQAAGGQAGSDGQRRAIMNAILNGLGGSTAGRLSAP